ncbi:uncharacterized protein DUF3152 [Micromonospora pisi]|uniref:Uncharacterized protein DUF3152 n=1 Tax=Micromonospora pisi TaxID=589240 RepID=A0A495JMF4_9ACTN|nr:DUF3152 domain-containing protein [Micromonospora pisi]RKR89748.1 uncharacterized protein DUF3152 [Micromonospora pisi]
MPARRTGKRRRPSATRRLLPPAAVAVVVGVAIAVVGLTGAGRHPNPSQANSAASAAANPAGSGSPAPSAQAPKPVVTPSQEAVAPPKPVTYPETGPRTWQVADGRSKVYGTSGQLLRFRVSVENKIEGITANEFADAVVTTLGDPRSWTGNGQWRLQRVGPNETAAFTIYLASPATRDQLCQDGYDRYTSCRNGNSVVINVARWAHGVPNYGASLAEYQLYVINHEVGHRLGHGHELCPGKGELAPVMQQQTLGMHGCTANAWPLQNGKLYAGKPGQYNDPIPD